MMTIQALNRLRSDRTSGATSLGELAISIVEEFVSTQGAQETQDISEAAESLVQDILMAQPSMAVMLNLAQCVLEACADKASTLPMRQRVQLALSDFRTKLRRSMDALCRRALDVIPPRAAVLTYSNSTTVATALQFAQANGHLDRVYLSEARPAYDGRILAHSLAEVGVTVHYYTDMGLFGQIDRVDLVVLGADAIFPKHFLC